MATAEEIANFVKTIEPKTFLQDVFQVAAAGNDAAAQSAKLNAVLPRDAAPEYKEAVAHMAGLKPAERATFAKAAGLDGKEVEEAFKPLTETPAAPATAPKAPLPKPTDAEIDLLKKAGPDKIAEAEKAFGEMGKGKQWVGRHRLAAPGLAAAATLAVLALPNKQITKEDGTTEEKWGGGKKVAFATGAVVTGVTLGGGKKWGGIIKIAEAEAKRVAHNIPPVHI